MSTAFAALRTAAEKLDVHADTALARVIGFHPQDYHSNRLFARIRTVQKALTDDEPPQGFLCLYTTQISGKRLLFSNADAIEIIGELARPSSADPDTDARAPYLTLVVIGEAGGRTGLGALRAYAQPIYAPTQFLPIDSGFERDVVRAVNSARWSLSRRAPTLSISLTKPVFDMTTPDGPCRPDIVLDITDLAAGEFRSLVIEAMGFPDDPDYRAAKAITHARMAHIGPILEIMPGGTRDPKALARRIANAIVSGECD